MGIWVMDLSPYGAGTPWPGCLPTPVLSQMGWVILAPETLSLFLQHQILSLFPPAPTTKVDALKQR